MSEDDTVTMPIFVARPDVLPRWVMPALAFAYAVAGGVLSFACLVLAHAADQIVNTPFCRRL